MIKSTPGLSHFLIYLLSLFVLFGCAGAPTTPQPIEAKPVFYPAEPDLPRIQYLTSFSSPLDLEGKKSKFAEFVLGEDEAERQGLAKPYGVASRDYKLYAVDTRGGGYAVFDLLKNKFYKVEGMNKPINITIDDAGNKYVTDTMLDEIVIFGSNDQKIQTFSGKDEYKPSDVAIVGNKLYVTDLENHRIVVLDKATGQKISTIGKVGSEEGELFHPTNLAIAKNGDLLVSDTSNFRVSEFSPDGRYIRKLGEIGTSIGKFARPKGIATDQDGRIYVVDAAFQNIQVFDSQGQLLLFFGGAGTGPGQLYLPTDISIDYTSVDFFQKFAAPGFHLEYLILVANQFGPHKINVYGFGQMQGVNYATD